LDSSTLEKDPLEWWKGKYDQYPRMTVLVKKIPVYDF
jgi:hypothetical protein